MSNIVLYTSASCPFCTRAKALLEKKGASYEELSVDATPSLWNEIMQRCGRNTVPQLFVGERHVGGFDDMVELDMDDELDPLLANA